MERSRNTPELCDEWRFSVTGDLSAHTHDPSPTRPQPAEGGGVGPHWKPLRPGDVANWAALTAAAETVDQTGERYDADDLAEQLDDPLLDVAHGTRAAWDGDVMIAVGVLQGGPTGDPMHRMSFDGTVHLAYRRRGIGRQLMLWALQTAPELSEARHAGRPLQLSADVSELNAGKTALFEQWGFTPERWFFVMGRDLMADVPDVTAPDGLQITGFEFAYDTEALDVRNEAFADHWGSTPQTKQSWRQSHTGTRSFRPDLSFLAIADTRPHTATSPVAAILLTNYYEADTAATGCREAYIATIGTRRPWRRRGVATALISAALGEAKRQGFVRAALAVDAENPTGALSVYRAAGFEVEQRHSRYIRDFQNRNVTT
jgi:mycothiol synthase